MYVVARVLLLLDAAAPQITTRPMSDGGVPASAAACSGAANSAARRLATVTATTGPAACRAAAPTASPTSIASARVATTPRTCAYNQGPSVWGTCPTHCGAARCTLAHAEQPVCAVSEP